MIIVSLYIQINKKRCIGIVSGLVSYFLVNLALLMILIMFIWSSFVFNPYISGLSTGGNTITDTPRALLMFGDTLSNLWAIKAMIQMNWKNKKTTRCVPHVCRALPLASGCLFFIQVNNIWMYVYVTMITGPAWTNMILNIYM